MGLKTLLAELHHRNVYKVATVYLVVGLTALEGLTHLFHNFEAPHWVLKVLTTLLILGFPVACLMAWGFEFTPHGVRAAPTGRPPGSGSSTGGDASVQPDVAARPTVAVLPFVDMSPGGDQQYFGDGIAEELIGALSRIDGLRVAARTSTFALHAARAGMKEYGEVLHVAYVLEGSVRRAGDRVRITAQLIDVATSYHLFAQQYDRGIADVLAIQNEIARELVQALLPKLGLDARTPLLARGTANPEAHELRLKARQIFGHVTTPGSQRELIALLERAVALDPGYGAAWGDLSVAYTVDAAIGWSEPVPRLIRAPEAATRALLLDPDNALALITRGAMAAASDFDHAAADAYFRRARESGGDEAFWAFFVSWTHLLPLGRYAEALDILRQARDRDPYAPPARAGEIFALMALGRLPEAVALARTVQVEASPPLPLAGAAALCLSLAGLPTEAESLVAYVVARAGQFNVFSVVAQAALNSARHDDAANRTLLDALMVQQQAGNYVSPDAIAVVHVSLAQYDQALDWYERAVDARDPFAVAAAPILLRRHPVIGTDPRFLALLKRMHLPSQAELDAASGAAGQPGALRDAGSRGTTHNPRAD